MLLISEQTPSYQLHVNNNIIINVVQCNEMDALYFSFYQMTPLHLAVERSRIKIVECLLDQGADINLQDNSKVILHTNAVGYLS